MEWRCEWCGKPHEEDDPPCDNCGHGTFEKAVVRQAEPESGPDSTVVWVCTDCGREHTKHSPPCSRCNNATLERREKRIDDSNLTDAPGTGTGTDRTGNTEAETTNVWVCSDCGREHTKNSPPCSRCGGTDLQLEEKRIGARELSAPSYFELLTPQYLTALAVLLVVVAVFVLGFAGVLDIPGLGDGGVPEVENVPGDDRSTAEGTQLAAVETAYLEGVNERNEADGRAPLQRDDRLDEVATFFNQQFVRAEFGDGQQPTVEDVEDVLRDACGQNAPTGVRLVVASDEGSSDALADAFVDRYRSQADGTTGSRTGLDIHRAPDGSLRLWQVVC